MTDPAIFAGKLGIYRASLLNWDEELLRGLDSEVSLHPAL